MRWQLDGEVSQDGRRGPEYLCDDEKDAGEKRAEIQEGRVSRVRSLHRQEGMQAVVGLN